MAHLTGQAARDLGRKIVLDNPQGIKYSEVVAAIEKKHPGTPHGTVTGAVWNLDARFPSEISKAAKGLFVPVASGSGAVHATVPEKPSTKRGGAPQTSRKAVAVDKTKPNRDCGCGPRGRHSPPCKLGATSKKAWKKFSDEDAEEGVDLAQDHARPRYTLSTATDDVLAEFRVALADAGTPATSADDAIRLALMAAVGPHSLSRVGFAVMVTDALGGDRVALATARGMTQDSDVGDAYRAAAGAVVGARDALDSLQLALDAVAPKGPTPGERLREAMRGACISSVVLAAHLGYSHKSSIGNVVMGRAPLQGKTLAWVEAQEKRGKSTIAARPQ